MRRFSPIVVGILLLVSLTGCRSTYYHQRFPELERPDRPALVNVSGDEMKKMSPEARVAVTDNFNGLIDYVKKLEIAIDMYNAYAREKNAAMGLAKETD